MKQISQEEQNNFILHLQNGLTYREILKEVDISYVNVDRIAKGNKIERIISKGGRPSKLNEVDKRNIIRNITSGKGDIDVQATTYYITRTMFQHNC